MFLQQFLTENRFTFDLKTITPLPTTLVNTFK